jgi:mono/diheme cytochrome c family protein
MNRQGSMSNRNSAAPCIDIRRERRRWVCSSSFALAAALACAPRAGSPETRPRRPEPPSSLPEGAPQASPPPPSPPPEPGVTASAPPQEEHSDESHEHGGPRSSAAPPPAETMAQLEADERAAYDRAKPVFAAHCARCHTEGAPKASESARRHFDMDVYPFGGHHAAEMSKSLRRVLGATGGKPTMPRDDPGAVRGAELELVLALADAFDRAHRSEPLHAPDGHQH